MQARTRFILMVVVASSLAACSSMQEKSSYSAVKAESSPARIGVDEAYVARVESQAKQRGVDVHWVNVPTKRYAANP